MRRPHHPALRVRHWTEFIYIYIYKHEIVTIYASRIEYNKKKKKSINTIIRFPRLHWNGVYDDNTTESRNALGAGGEIFQKKNSIAAHAEKIVIFERTPIV